MRDFERVGIGAGWGLATIAANPGPWAVLIIGGLIYAVFFYKAPMDERAIDVARKACYRHEASYDQEIEDGKVVGVVCVDRQTQERFTVDPMKYCDRDDLVMATFTRQYVSGGKLEPRYYNRCYSKGAFESGKRSFSYEYRLNGKVLKAEDGAINLGRNQNPNVKGATDLLPEKDRDDYYLRGAESPRI